MNKEITSNTRNSIKDKIKISKKLLDKKISGSSIITVLTNKRNKNDIKSNLNYFRNSKLGIKKNNYLIEPEHYFHNVNDVLKSNNNIEVSIIIPLYNSKNQLLKQIQSWTKENVKYEIIYVDDQCPENSHSFINDFWMQKNFKNIIGKIIVNKTNSGFSNSCNIGAKYANGKYLVFLNADTRVTEGWLKNLIDSFQNNFDVGIVGNLQIRGEDQVDSLGSEWCWRNKTFSHIGRNVYNESLLSKPWKLNEIPKELKSLRKVEMVTGCCFAIPTGLFNLINGFDNKFKLAYWEDSDICMKVKSENYDIMINPNSKIYHEVGHTKSAGHPFINDNKKYFYKKWLDTGRIDPLINKPRENYKNIKDNVDGKVVGCVIACNEEEFLELSVNSISSLVDRWIFVIGGNEYAYKAGMCNEKGFPSDNTLEIARNLANKYGGEVIEPPGRLWHNKVEMRNSYANKLKNNEWMFMLDGDEVYSNNQLWRVVELMNEYEVLIMQYYVFWNKINVLGTDKWQKYPQERIVKWKKEYSYKGNNHFQVSNNSGILAANSQPCYRGDENLFFHYSWIRPIEKIKQKREYYKYQSNNKNDTYVDNIYLKWRENPQSVKNNTHPMGGGGWKYYNDYHPKEVQLLINEGKLNY